MADPPDNRWWAAIKDPRSKRVVTSALAGGSARVVTMLCSFASIPLCLGYLGSEAFGVWATITSLVAVLAFADFGIGNGIINRIASSHGAGNTAAVRRTIASALCVLSVIAALVVVIFGLNYATVSWHHLLGISNELPPETVALAVLVFTVLFAVNLPTTILQRIQYALQMGHLNGLSQAVAGILSLALMYLVAGTDLGLPGMIAAFLLAPIVATWLSAIWMFWRVPELRPRTTDVQPKEMNVILRSGIQFLTTGVAFSLCFTTDNLIIAHALGPEAVTSYAVHQKYLSVVTFLGGLILIPLWPAYAEAFAASDIRWVRRVLKRSVVTFGVIGVTAPLLLIAVAEPVMHLWLEGKIVPDYFLYAALCLWVSIEMIGKAFSMFLNGVGVIKEQMWVALAFIPVCVGMKLWFVFIWGAPGVPFATALAYVLVHVPLFFFLVRRWCRENPLDGVAR